MRLPAMVWHIGTIALAAIAACGGDRTTAPEVESAPAGAIAPPDLSVSPSSGMAPLHVTITVACVSYGAGSIEARLDADGDRVLEVRHADSVTLLRIFHESATVRGQCVAPTGIVSPVISRMVEARPRTPPPLLEDHFDVLDPDIWTKGQPWGPGQMLDKNVVVEDGRLVILGTQERTNGFDWASGFVSTHDKFSFLYGMVEVRAKVPQGIGFFPAVWLLPAGTSEGDVDGPELDMLEVRGRAPTEIIAGVFDETSTKVVKVRYDAGLDLTEDFHTYTLSWTPGRLAWSLDGDLFHEHLGPHVPDVPLYLMISMSVGGNTWIGTPDATTPWPGRYEIDYVRILPFDERQ